VEVVPKVLFEVQVVVQRVDLRVPHHVFDRPAAVLVAAQAPFDRPAVVLVAAQAPFDRPAAVLVAAQAQLKVLLGQNRVHLNLQDVLRLVVHQEGGHDEKTISTES
jgi:hypothetical protein